jgi:DNA-binding NarL/FixJ family response regulator
LSSPITCIIADDHPAVVKGVKEYLTAQGIHVLGDARLGDAALALIEQTRPNMAIVDLRRPGLSGVQVTQRSTELTSVIFYTAHGERALVTEALDAGARGFVLKEAPLSELLRAVQTVAAGGIYVDPPVAGLLLGTAAVDEQLKLTKRERDTLRLLADGLTNDEIGKRLTISSETVRTHLHKAMTKLQADTRTQAVATALRRSLIA